MSLEASIASLTTQAGLLLDLPQQIATVAQDQIVGIGNAYTQLISKLTVNYHVDPVNGLDTNAGTLASPFKTILKALQTPPRGTKVNVLMMADCIVDAEIYVDAKHVSFIPADGLAKTITFSGRTSINLGGGNIARRLNAFAYTSGSTFSFYNTKVVVPEPVGAESGWNVGWSAGVIRPYDGYGSHCSVYFYLGEIMFPAVAFGQLVVGGNVNLTVNSTTITGSALGKWVGSEVAGMVVAGAGTPTNTIGWLSTNLTTV